MKEIHFEHKVTFTEDTLRQIRDPEKKLTWRSPLFIYALLIPGVIMLTSKYTFITGILVVFLSVILLIIKLTTKPAEDSGNGKYPHPKSEIDYSFDHSGYRLRGKNIEASVEWSRLSSWLERNGWVILTCIDDLPGAYFPVSALMEEGAYDELILLCKTHAKIENKE